MLYGAFDTSIYPGDGQMAALREYFDTVAFYLGPAPSHGDDSWMDKRAYLVGLGYGLIPIYVGQQTTGPGSHIVTAAQGETDAQGCAALMAKAGFPPCSRVFDDLENGAPLTSDQADYVSALGEELANLGWAFGVYASHSFASEVPETIGMPDTAMWSFNIPTTSSTTSPLPVTDFPTSMDGADCPGAMVWQYRQNVTIDIPDYGTLVIDLDVATVQDPSAPAKAPAPAPQPKVKPLVLAIGALISGLIFLAGVLVGRGLR